MKFNRFNKKFRSVLTASLAGLSAVGGSASAMQYVPAQGTPGYPVQPVMMQQQPVQSIVIQQGGSNEIGKYKISKQLAKNLKDKRERKVWTGTDTVIQTACAFSFLAGNGYNVYNGNWNVAKAGLFDEYEISKAYLINPFLKHADDPTETKTVSEWGITEEILDRLPTREKRYSTDPDLDQSLLCQRSYLTNHTGNGDDEEPVGSERLYQAGKLNPATGQPMTLDEQVLRPKYSFARIKDKPLTRWQAEIILKNDMNAWPTTTQIVSMAAPWLAIPVAVGHLSIKGIQKVVDSAGQVIDKQQDISAMRAITN